MKISLDRRRLLSNPARNNEYFKLEIICLDQFGSTEVGLDKGTH